MNLIYSFGRVVTMIKCPTKTPPDDVNPPVIGSVPIGGVCRSLGGVINICGLRMGLRKLSGIDYLYSREVVVEHVKVRRQDELNLEEKAIGIRITVLCILRGIQNLFAEFCATGAILRLTNVTHQRHYALSRIIWSKTSECHS